MSVFAAGDVRAGSTAQLAFVVCDGAAAAIQVRHYIDRVESLSTICRAPSVRGERDIVKAVEREGERQMEPGEIFELIVKADEKLKYATAGKGDLRAKQAADLLTQAIGEAEAIDNEALVQQAKVRLADLDTLLDAGRHSSDEGSGDGGSGDGGSGGAGPAR